MFVGKMAERRFGLYLMKKRGTKSSVWQHFGLVAMEEGTVIERDKDKPVCRECGRSVLAKGSNTSNLSSIYANTTRNCMQI